MIHRLVSSSLSLVGLLAVACSTPITAPAIDAGTDAGGTDAGGTDGGVAVDAPSSSDGGTIDAPVVGDAGGSDAGSSDAGLAPVPGWLVGFGDDGDDGAVTVAATATRIYVGGRADGHVVFGMDPGGAEIAEDFAADGFVAAFDREGRPLWVRRYGGGVGADIVRELAVDEAGNLYVAGEWQGTADFGDGVNRSPNGTNVDIFVLSLDASGALRWPDVVTFGSTSAPEETGGLAYDPVSDRIVVSGAVFGATDFGGGTRPYLNTPGLGGADGFVAAFDAADGGHVWDRTMRSRGYSYALAVAVDPVSGDVTLGGTVGEGLFEPVVGDMRSSGSPGDGFLARYSGDGTALRWAHVFGGSCTDCYTALLSLAVGPDQTIYAVGQSRVDWSLGGFSFSSAGGYDGWLLSLAPAGTTRWGLPLRGGIGGEVIASAAVDGDGSLWLVGQYSSTASFGYAPSDTPLPTGDGPSDGFLAHFTDTGSAAMASGASLRVGSTGDDAAFDVAIGELGHPVLVGQVGATGAMAEGDTLGFFGGAHDAVVWRHVAP